MLARITKVVVVSVVASVVATSAMAYDRRRHRHNHGYAHPQQYYGNRHDSNAGAWVAGAIGLGILGAIIASESQRQCYDDMVGYDRYGREIWRTICN